MYRWCSHCQTKYKTGTHICTNPKCKNKQTGHPWKTDVEFDAGDILQDKKRKKRFRIIRRLSKHADAGMSAVYLVQRADKTYKQAVIKITKVKAQLPVLRREVYHLQRLKHNHVIKLAYGANMVDPNNAILHDRQDGQRLYFIALEYLAGGSAKDKIGNKRQLVLAEAARITDEMAQALDYIHLQNVVHLDVKPANILFDAHGRAVLADFGVARTQGDLNGMRSTNLSGSAVSGTPAYNAPEKCQHVITDKRADIFALGLTLYELLVGDSPVRYKTTTGKDSKHASATRSQRCVNVAELPSPCSLNNKIPPAVEGIILKAIHINREKRYQTAGALVADLNRVIKKDAPISTPKRLKRIPIFIIGLLLLAAVGGGVMFMLQNDFITAIPLLTNIVRTTSGSTNIILGENVPAAMPSETANASIPAVTRTNPKPTVTLSRRIELAATSTLAKLPSPTPSSTATTIPAPTPENAFTPAPMEIPSPIIVLSGSTLAGNQAQFWWRWIDGTCAPPPEGYGFEIRLWLDRPGIDPLGAMDAGTEQNQIVCNAGSFYYTMTDVTKTSGVIAAHGENRFKWDVALVHLDPYTVITRLLR